MITDSRLLFGESFDCDQEIGTYVLTNQVDLGANHRDIGQGQPLYFVVAVTDEAFTDGGDSATATFQLVSDSTAALSSPTIHVSSGTLLKAALGIGAVFVYPVPMEGNTFERYLGAQLVVGTAGFDSGMIDAFLTIDPYGWQAYPDAVN